MSDFSRVRLLSLFTSAPKAFWRHDVDLSLDAAVKMARFAQIAGVKSVFYLMPRSEFYNLFSESGAAAIAEIKERGHTLGVHTDADRREPGRAAQRDLALVERDYPYTFERKVSFHIPNSLVLWRDFKGFENAYASRWEGRYLSDSRGVALNGNARNGWQINLHPEHWQL